MEDFILIGNNFSGLLDCLSEWILKYHEICRPQDMFALFHTLANVNHQPINSEILYKVTFIIFLCYCYNILFISDSYTPVSHNRCAESLNMVRCCLVSCYIESSE